MTPVFIVLVPQSHGQTWARNCCVRAIAERLSTPHLETTICGTGKTACGWLLRPPCKRRRPAPQRPSHCNARARYRVRQEGAKALRLLSPDIGDRPMRSRPQGTRRQAECKEGKRGHGQAF